MVEGRDRYGEYRNERDKQNLEKRKKDKERTEIECGGKRERGSFFKSIKTNIKHK